MVRMSLWNTIKMSCRTNESDVDFSYFSLLKSKTERKHTKMHDIKIRMATPEDAEMILNIYAYYVEKTAITFEYDVPSVEEFRNRIGNTLKKYPYLVILVDENIMGYAYAGTFKNRAAYDRSVEMSIYLAHNAVKCGLGKRLYLALEEKLKEMGILNLYACIGYPLVENEYLTKNSAEFHEHLGYRTVGRFHKCGYKFGRWYDMIWMEKIIGEHIEEQNDRISGRYVDSLNIL